MQRRIAFAASIIVALTGAAALAACPPDHPNPKPQSAKKRPAAAGCVDLNTLPQISDHIVAGEHAGPTTKPAYTPPQSRKYEGPTLGLTKPEPGVRPTPTVGYHWALE